MKVDKALRHVLRVGSISIYRVAVESQMDRGSMGQIVRGERGANWDVVEKIAKGLERIHPSWRGMFLYNLNLPQDAFPETPIDEVPLPSLEDTMGALEDMERMGQGFPPEMTHSQVIRHVQKMGVDVEAWLQQQKSGLPGIREDDSMLCPLEDVGFTEQVNK